MNLVALKISFRIGIFCLLVLTSLACHAERQDKSQLPDSVISALQKAKIPLQNVAVFVQALDDNQHAFKNENQPTISHNTNQRFNPASVMKLVTTYAALDLLGPAYRWRTEI